MTQKKILFFNSKSYDEKTFKATLESLNAQDKLHLTFLESKLNEETVTEAQGYDGICIVDSDARNSNVIEKIPEYCDTVKIIVLRSAGHSGSSIEVAKNDGIEVCRAPHAVAEYAVALLLSLNRNMDRAFRTKLHNFTLDGLFSVDVFGKTAGIIGSDGVGMYTAGIFLDFGCKFLCYDVKTDGELAKQKGFTDVSIGELLQQSDIVSLHAPLNNPTYHMIDAKAFNKMKQDAVLINTSRAPLVDTKTLVDCLKSGKLRGAALDVHKNEEKSFF